MGILIVIYKILKILSLWQNLTDEKRWSSYQNGTLIQSDAVIKVWKSSRPASLLLTGLTLWPNWLEHWPVTLSVLSSQVRIPAGTLHWGACPQAWVKPSALIVHSESTGCHVSGLVRMAVIQIKTCAEYRDMLPQPRLVNQPKCTWQTRRGLGSMSRYSAQIFIFYIAYIFHFVIPLWVWLGALPDCDHAQCPLPLSIVIRMRLVIRQSKLPACLADVQLAQENTLAFMPQDWQIDR